MKNLDIKTHNEFFLNYRDFYKLYVILEMFYQRIFSVYSHETVYYPLTSQAVIFTQ